MLERLSKASVVGLFLVINLFLIAPFMMYYGNVGEFVVPFPKLLQPLSLYGVVVFTVIVLLSIITKDLWFKRYISVLFIVGILFYIQGNLLVWKYGLIGGSEIDFSKGLWRGLFDSLLWLLLLVISQKYYSQIYASSRFIVSLFLALQLLLVCYCSYQKPGIWKSDFSANPPPERMFNFSKQFNIIHIVMDELQSTVFNEIIQNDQKVSGNDFAGFVFFPEATSSYPTTIMSVPSFVSGKLYKNDMVIKDFFEGYFKGKTIAGTLFENGFDVEIASSLRFYDIKNTVNYNIPIPYSAKEHDFLKTDLYLMTSLVLFRHSPHFLKKYILREEKVLNKNKSSKTLGSFLVKRVFSHVDFFNDMIMKATVTNDKPVYKLMHLYQTHYPPVLNEDGKYAGTILPWKWENIKNQDRFCIYQLTQFFKKLKQLGIYDSSLIIVHADHGYHCVGNSLSQFEIKNPDANMNIFPDNERFAQVLSSSLPLLMIKPQNSKGPMRVSKIQAELKDLPDTISHLSGFTEAFGGKSVFKLKDNEVRPRSHFYYVKIAGYKDKRFEEFDEYTITGSAFDKKAWKFVPNKTK